jgi:hypothetical protein
MGDTRGGSTRARNVLQHGLLWMTEDRFRDQLSERGTRMLQALIDMKEGVKGMVLHPSNYYIHIHTHEAFTYTH